MKNINSARVFRRNGAEPNADGGYVLYWMHSNRRVHYNHALEYAVAWANKLAKPLLIYDGLNVDYPWACDRFHAFIADGMQERAAACRALGVAYAAYVEPEPKAGRGLVEALASEACLVVSDEYPVFIMRSFNDALAKRLGVPFVTVDNNGVIPLGLTDKAPYSAFLFRRVVQKRFLEAWRAGPKPDPLLELTQGPASVSAWIFERWPQLMTADRFVRPDPSGFPINHSVSVLDYPGTRKEGLRRLHDFVGQRLKHYGERRNDPDAEAVSGMSPFLHFGLVSEHEVVAAAFAAQPPDWSLDHLSDKNGQSDGFYGGHSYVEKFLDEVVTWRGVGFHFAHHTSNYDQLESLPAWALATLAAHKADPREHLYPLEQLEAAETSDPVWNAAQRELVKTGGIHNYLRMVWGKKVVEWTPDADTALAYLIELNNKYGIDGRDPNSYSGIFWCLGRFDRPWFERPIFGTVRYMSTESARKKVKMDRYLQRFGQW